MRRERPEQLLHTGYVELGGHLFIAYLAFNVAFDVIGGESQIEREHSAVLRHNFQRDLVPVNLAGFDIKLFVFAGTGGARDLATVLLEVQEGSVGFGFAIGAGNVEAAGPFSSHIGQ